MPKLDYSPAAYNVLARFYRAKSILYVEGDDDVPFWNKIFKELTDIKVQIIPVGGADQIDEKIDMIFSEPVNFLAARDSDFIRLSKNSKNHPRILYTYGYSIENTLLTRSAIAELTGMACRSDEPDTSKVDSWIDKISASLSDLIRHDIANYISKKGVAVLFDNCTRLMQSEKSCLPCTARINAHQSKIATHFKPDLLNIVDTHLAEHGIPIEFHLRGHFLLSAVYKYIDGHVKSSRKGEVSYESIYVGAIQYLGIFLKMENEHALHYRGQVQNAIASLTPSR
ncbi:MULTISPECIES: DUF4435 domain-containing protein [unclassified Pseudomonas]|uniref:DUF4435 domain-containing protein n=1 Tax=unclassified Pseudomonas TaxID=196821 RepID=UPI000C2FC945|nr:MULTISPECIES: DUF4435 domain-containing protein [unclassified Pseudomonas]MCU1741165.1 DUF4435 domain-containing protein [Pseudomonas sp. 20S_6.2_Bac1]